MIDNKKAALNEIQKVVPVFRNVNGVEYRIRCPICGDTQKDPNDSHCYIKCSNDPSEPMLWHCFLCNNKGMVNKYFMSKLGVPQNVINKVELHRYYNRIPLLQETNIDIITGKPVMESPQVRFIEARLGKGLTEDDYDRFKIVWDMNELCKYITSQRVRNGLPCNIDSISFLSDNKSMVMSRTFDMGSKESQWRKITIVKSDQRSFYTIKTQLDLFTRDPIVVNIAEGIFDILSVYKNFREAENEVYIAALGSDYISALDYMIAKGFIGHNVLVKIYIDDGINEQSLIRGLKRYKWIFKSISIFKNMKSKDVGVPIDQIKLVERRV